MHDFFSRPDFLRPVPNSSGASREQFVMRLCNAREFPVTITLLPVHADPVSLSDAAFLAVPQLSAPCNWRLAVQRGGLHAKRRPKLACLAFDSLRFSSGRRRLLR